MVWPGVSDYQEAIQAPQLCFGDRDLKDGSPVLTSLGLPRPISGGNASVYQIRSGKHEFAVRCFLRDIPDLRQRYAAIDQHLRSSRLPAKVGFEYLQEGIRIRGKWYPILKMMWVRGVPINEHIESIRQDRSALGRLLDDWQALLKSLEKEQIAHGDLQHGNVLVAKDKLLLIDYDGLYVPALRGNPSHELGHPSYQHPRRQQSDFGPDIDRFSALVIHVGIRALLHAPQLWDKYNNSDNVLFTREDFAEPGQSPLFAELEQVGDADFAAIVRALRHACSQPVEQVPRLADAVQVGRAVGTAAKANAAPPAPAAAPQAAAPASGGKKKRKKGRTQHAPPGAAQPAPGAGKPQWLADLLGTAPAAASAPATANVAFSLGQVWKRDVQTIGTRPAAPTAQRGGWQRALVWLLLCALLLGSVHLLARPFFWPAVVVCVGLSVWSRRRRKRALAGAGATASPTSRAPVVRSLAFSLDGRSIAVAGEDRYAHVLEAGTGRPLRRLGPHGLTVTGVAAAGVDRFATCAWDGTIRVFDAAGGVARLFRDARCHSAAGSVDGRWLAFGTGGGLIKVCSSDGQERLTLRGHKRQVQGLAFARDKRRLVSGSADHTARTWSLDSRSCEHVLRGHHDAVEAVAITGDGQLVATGSRDGRVCIWDAGRGRLLHEIDTRSTGVRALAFAPDGGSLLAGGGDRSIHCVDVATGKVAGKVAGHAAAVTALAVSADGSRVASADADGTVFLWLRRTARAAPAPAALQPQLQRP